MPGWSHVPDLSSAVQTWSVGQGGTPDAAGTGKALLAETMARLVHVTQYP